MIQRIRKWLRKKLINWLVHDLYNLIDKNDLLQSKKDEKGLVYFTFRGKTLDPSSVNALRKGSTALLDSQLWKVLSLELKYHGSKKIYYNSKTDEDYIGGKLILYLVDVIESTLKDIREV